MFENRTSVMVGAILIAYDYSGAKLLQLNDAQYYFNKREKIATLTNYLIDPCPLFLLPVNEILANIRRQCLRRLTAVGR